MLRGNPANPPQRKDRRPMPNYFEPEIECASRETLRQIQSQRLVKMVKHCYEHVPFYKKKFDEIGLRPEDIRSIATTCKSSPLPQSRICGIPIPSASSPCPGTTWPESTPPPAPRASRRWWPTPKTTWTSGPAAPPAPLWAAAAPTRTSSTSAMATACSPAAWASTTALRSWAPR